MPKTLSYGLESFEMVKDELQTGPTQPTTSDPGGEAAAPATPNPRWWPIAFFAVALLVSGGLTAWLVTSGHTSTEFAQEGGSGPGSRRIRGFLILLQLGESAAASYGYLVAGLIIPVLFLVACLGCAAVLRKGGQVPDWLSLGAPAVGGWWLGSLAATMMVGFHLNPASLSGTWVEQLDSATAARNAEEFLLADALGRLTLSESGAMTLTIHSPSQHVGMSITGRISIAGRMLTPHAESGTSTDGTPIKVDELQILNQELVAPDEVVKLTPSELVLRDTKDGVVTRWQRIK